MKRVFAFIFASMLFGSIHAQCSLSCHDNITVSLNSTGQHIVDLGEIISGNISGCTDVIVKLFDENGTYFGDTITCAYVGQSIEAQALNTVTNNYCTTTIAVMDYQSPNISCQDIFIFCNGATDPIFTGFPLVSDNCTFLDSTDLVFSDALIDLDCFITQGSETVTAKIERTWTVVDDSGNQDVCLQNIYLKRVTLGNVVFPAHHDGFALPELVCSVDDPLDFSVAGEPTIFGKPIDNSGSCEIVVTYSDQSFPSCGGGTRILRNWQVFDFCANTNQQQIQVIKVEDQIAPIITCPGNVTLGLDPYACSSTVNLVHPTATDECSNVTLSASWTFGSGFGPFSNIPPGIYPVTYTATDDCGNISSCLINVTLEDDNPPSSVCKNSLSVSLLNTGDVRLYATNMDGGSSDNCQIVSTLASRDNSSFGDYVTFTCDDIENSPILVTFKVIDAAGLSNTCEINISVYDYIKPTVVCPPDLTLNCQTDINNLSITSQAAAVDNCGIDTIYYEDDITNIVCGNELITRKWVIIDIHGNKDSCFQHLQLEDLATLSIQFPSNISIDICQATLDPSFTGVPTIFGEGCKDILMSHQDNFFFSSNSCTIIQRVWEVTNWCVYQPNSGSTNGQYFATQLITVQDNSAPVFTCNDTIVYGNSVDCATMSVSLPDVDVFDCDSDLTIINDSPFATSSGNNASGLYPIGTYTINFIAVDGCGNQSSCSFVLNVKDNVGPSANCKSNLSFNLDSSGNLTITPDQIDNGSSDNCGSENLTMTVFPNQFDCSSVGFQNVVLTVTDESGNSSTCQSEIEIIDDNICSGKIYGTILNPWGDPVLETTVFIQSSQHLYEAITDSNGYYEVDAEIGETYTISPTKDVFIKNGISTSDVILMVGHVLGTHPLVDPYLLIAADVNSSGKINVIDIIRLRKVLLNISDGFGNTDSWRFIQSAYELTFNQSSNFPGTYSVPSFSGDIVSYDFKGIKTGDLNKDSNAGRNTNRNLEFQIDNVNLKKGNTYSIPIYYQKSDDDMQGIQMAIQFPFNSVSNVKLLNRNLDELSNNYSYDVGNDVLKISWNKMTRILLDVEQPLFYLSFVSESSDLLSDLITISNRYLEGESYFWIDDVLEIGSVSVKWKDFTTVIEIPISKPEVFPNPVSSFTNISFSLKKSGLVHFEFVNLYGQLVYSFQKYLKEGDNLIRIDRERLNQASGLILCDISIAEKPIYQNIKLLLME